MSYRTPSPLQRARGLGSAKAGVEHWWIQRLTALALLPLMTWLLLALLWMGDYEYTTLVAWAACPVNAILLTSTVLALFWHSALGLQVIIEDYIDSKGLQLTLSVAVKFMHLLFAIVSVFAILKIALGPA
jgi:succinate dehydrogenase / fumarate reductase membrane anchor subunit